MTVANRCAVEDCRKRLLPSDMPCRCKQRFCTAHRYPETHECTYDFKKENAEKCAAAAEKMRCVASKVTPI